MNPDETGYWRKRRHKRRECLTYKKVDRLLHRRQEYACAFCGISFEETDFIDIHRIVPRSQGGTNEVDNLILVHSWCGKAYHTRSAAQA